MELSMYHHYFAFQLNLNEENHIIVKMKLFPFWFVCKKDYLQQILVD